MRQLEEKERDRIKVIKERERERTLAELRAWQRMGTAKREQRPEVNLGKCSSS